MISSDSLLSTASPNVPATSHVSQLDLLLAAATHPPRLVTASTGPVAVGQPAFSSASLLWLPTSAAAAPPPLLPLSLPNHMAPAVSAFSQAPIFNVGPFSPPFCASQPNFHTALICSRPATSSGLSAQPQVQQMLFQQQMMVHMYQAQLALLGSQAPTFGFQRAHAAATMTPCSSPAPPFGLPAISLASNLHLPSSSTVLDLDLRAWLAC